MIEGLNARKSAGMAVGAEEGDGSSPIDDSPRLAARIQVRHLDTGVRSVSGGWSMVRIRVCRQIGCCERPPLLLDLTRSLHPILLLCSGELCLLALPFHRQYHGNQPQPDSTLAGLTTGLGAGTSDGADGGGLRSPRNPNPLSPSSNNGSGLETAEWAPNSLRRGSWVPS